jgi:hypothetical protein
MIRAGMWIAPPATRGLNKHKVDNVGEEDANRDAHFVEADKSTAVAGRSYLTNVDHLDERTGKHVRRVGGLVYSPRDSWWDRSHLHVGDKRTSATALRLTAKPTMTRPSSSTPSPLEPVKMAAPRKNMPYLSAHEHSIKGRSCTRSYSVDDDGVAASDSINNEPS